MKNIPNRIREFRKRNNLRQIDVAEKLGFKSTDRISRWEKGLQYPHVTNLLQLAKLFGVHAEEGYEDVK